MTYISAAMSKDRQSVQVWERTDSGKRICINYNVPYYFYIEDKAGKYKDIYKKNLKRLDYDNYFEFKDARDDFKSDNIKLYESDINPVYKVLSEKYYNKPVKSINCTYFDIEVDYKNFRADPDLRIKVRGKEKQEMEISVYELRKLLGKVEFEVLDEANQQWIKAQYSKYVYDGEIGFPSPEECYAKVSAISLYHGWKDEMILLVVLPENGKWTANDIPKDCYDLARVVVCKDEIELLTRFYEEIEDSDVLSGWNSEGFDIPYLYFRTKTMMGERWANKLSFSDATPPRVKEVEKYIGQKQKNVDIYGRCHLDYLELFKKLETTTRPSFTLDAISDEVLPEEKKLEFDCSLYDLYYERFPDFCRYNIRDTVVLKGFEKKLGYMGVAIMTYHSGTVLINDVLGTIRLVESTIVNKCHHILGVKVPDTKDIALSSEPFAGALVTAPKVGWHKWVVSLDYSSLYPSNIRALNISPEKIIGQFLDNYEAYEEICLKSNKPLTLIKVDNTSETHRAEEWPDILKNSKYSLSAYGTVFDQNEQGFIPEILEEWYSERTDYKDKASEALKKMKEFKDDAEKCAEYRDKYEYYHKLQFIKKILLNSTYGAMGNKFFRFYDLRMAESTTRSGRECLMEMNRIIANTLNGNENHKWVSAQQLPKTYGFPDDFIIYNDTDSTYFSLEKKNINDVNKIYEIATLMEKVVNKHIMQFTIDNFMCNDNYSNIIKVALDSISDNCIFVDKKYYVMHLLYEDGKPKEKMKVMGLQIKKTTIPKPISKKLTDYVEQLLKGRDWLELSRDIVEYKDYLLKEAKIVEIGLPKGIKKIEFYTSQYNANIPNLRIPGHVAAAMFYNKCLEVYKDIASPKIVSGMKIKTYYLKKKYGYFKSIALPTDLQIIPDWFTENFLNMVDKKAQVDRLVDNPMNSILKAIGKISPTKKTILIDELFEY